MKYYFLFLLLLAGKLYTQDTLKYTTGEVIITSGRIKATEASQSRDIKILSQDEVIRSSGIAVPEVIQHIPGVDVRQRGNDGIQSDISIRGGTFEQTLVLVDGIAVSDPQTGHHNMNLPLGINDIQSIEILKGQGSSVYGANAFSGVINIITKLPAKDGIHASAYGGTFGSFGLSASVSKLFILEAGTEGNRDAVLSSRLSFNRNGSEGYIANTDYRNNSLFVKTVLEEGERTYSLSFAAIDKKFGANSFYTPVYKEQYEEVKTFLTILKTEFSIGKTDFNINSFYRHNADEYFLIRSNPEFFHNSHKSNSYGIEASSQVAFSFGKFLAGAGFRNDEMKSSNLGERTRESGGAFFEFRSEPFRNLYIDVSGYAHKYAEIGWKFWPSAGISWNYSENLRVFASFGKAFRIPSFTELYYVSRTSLGNSALKSEESVNYEAGINASAGILSCEATYFHKKGKNLIDWVKLREVTIFRAMNISQININGIELGLYAGSMNLGFAEIKKIGAALSIIDVGRSTAEYSARDLSENVKNSATGTIVLGFGDKLECSWIVSYENRNYYNDRLIIDTKFSYFAGNVKLYLSVSNLGNKIYEDFTGLPLPGRWIRAGIEI